jgi:biopolymer transport protein ExbD
MALPNGSSNDGPLVAINVTPLVDVMLVLLAIFMITARLDDEQALPLDLPKAASGEATQRILNIGIDRAGVRTVDGVPVPNDETLRLRALELYRHHPDTRTIIQASRAAEHGVVMRVLDLLRLAGISKVAFAVEPEP